MTHAAGVITDGGDGFLCDASGNVQLDAADHADLRVATTGDFTLELWVSPNYEGASFGLISKDKDFRLQMLPGTYRFSVLGAGGWYTECDTDTIPGIGEEVHLVFTWNGTSKEYNAYVNGSLENTVDASGFGYSPTTSGWGTLRIGKNADSLAGSGPLATSFAQGTIDEVAIYPFAMDSSDVLLHYLEGTA
jgi:hypothetical protein